MMCWLGVWRGCLVHRIDAINLMRGVRAFAQQRRGPARVLFRMPHPPFGLLQIDMLRGASGSPSQRGWRHLRLIPCLTPI